MMREKGERPVVTREPDYHKRFRCLGGACPDTCCRDWEIVLDEGALADYRGAPEPLRGRIAAGLTENGEGEVCFRLREDGFCALLTPEGLCSIQRDWGETRLCAHCGAYPRFTEEYGCLTETVLAVSCPEAARLLAEAARFELTEHDDGGNEPPFDGVDAGLLRGLETTRARALAALEERERPLWGRLAQVLALADDGQDCVDLGAWDALADCRVYPAGEGEPDRRRLLAARLMTVCGALEPLRPAWPELLKRRGAELERMTGDDYACLRAEYQRACPGWEGRLTNLACYLVFRYWHKAVNDDDLYGRGALPAAVCLLLYHLALLAWRERGRFGVEDEALLWSAFSREIEHMTENLDCLLELLRDRDQWPLYEALGG